MTKLVDLYKESSEEWSKKAGELEGVIRALEVRITSAKLLNCILYLLPVIITSVTKSTAYTICLLRCYALDVAIMTADLFVVMFVYCLMLSASYNNQSNFFLFLSKAQKIVDSLWKWNVVLTV